MTTRTYRRGFEVLAAAGLMATFGCAGVKQHAGGSGGGSGASTGNATGTGGSGPTTGAGGSSVIVPTGCNGQCTDFEPTQDNPNPIFDINVPSDVGGMFGSPSGSGLCMTEPENGSLFPNNWLPPRIHVPGNSGYLKITFHADMESTDLVAYTQGDSWALPKPIWQNLVGHIVEQPITVTVQAPNGSSMSVMFQIAPVSAGGSMVFWSADPSQVGKQGVESMAQSAVVNDSYLLGFAVGDTSTTKALTIDQVQQEVLTNDQHTVRSSRCIGCHTGTPDGNYVSYVDAWPWPSVFANVEADPTLHGQAMPNYLGCDITPVPLTMSTTACSMSMPPTEIQYAWNGPMTFSPAHWTDPASGTGERIAITTSQMLDFTQPWTTYDYEPGQLTWLDLNSNASSMVNGLPVPTQGSAYGYLARTGDPNPAAGFPNWSQDGNTIVYVSTQCQNPSANGNCGTQDGRLAKGPADVYQIPYNNKAGGTATPVPGASDSSMDEYYPSLSPDGDFLAFNSIPTGNGQMYANPLSELYVVPFNNQPGTKAVRMAANDPPACTNLKSPGINNHWPKWSPTVSSASNGKTYYWIIFSSNRYNPTPQTVTVNGSSSVVYVSQLYITAVVRDEINTYTYPAIYLYNQPDNRLNTTPAWQDFHIPIVVN